MVNGIDYIKGVLYMSFIFLGVKTGTVKVMSCLMVADSILGVIKAMRLGRDFDLKVLIWGVITKLAVLIIPLVVALVGKGLGYDFSHFVAFSMSVIVLSEGVSCLSNVRAIKTRKDIKNVDYISLMLGALKKSLTLLLARYIDLKDYKDN